MQSKSAQETTTNERQDTDLLAQSLDKKFAELASIKNEHLQDQINLDSESDNERHAEELYGQGAG